MQLHSFRTRDAQKFPPPDAISSLQNPSQTLHITHINDPSASSFLSVPFFWDVPVIGTSIYPRSGQGPRRLPWLRPPVIAQHSPPTKWLGPNARSSCDFDKPSATKSEDSAAGRAGNRPAWRPTDCDTVGGHPEGTAPSMPSARSPRQRPPTSSRDRCLPRKPNKSPPPVQRAACDWRHRPAPRHQPEADQATSRCQHPARSHRS